MASPFVRSKNLMYIFGPSSSYSRKVYTCIHIVCVSYPYKQIWNKKRSYDPYYGKGEDRPLGLQQRYLVLHLLLGEIGVLSVHCEFETCEQHLQIRLQYIIPHTLLTLPTPISPYFTLPSYPPYFILPPYPPYFALSPYPPSFTLPQYPP